MEPGPPDALLADAAGTVAHDALLDDMGMDDPAECGEGMQLLDIVEALSAHFHEHHEAVLRWPFRLFCAKWRRMMVQVAKRESERKRDQVARERRRAEDAAAAALRRAHAAQWGD